MMSEMLEDLPGTSVYMDDILVWSSTEQEHDDRLRLVLTRLRRGNVTLNLESCRIGLQETFFFWVTSSARLGFVRLRISCRRCGIFLHHRTNRMFLGYGG